jgi:hypothetical protein
LVEDTGEQAAQLDDGLHERVAVLCILVLS